MAGPLSGIAGQQVPFANTFRPGGSQQETPIQQQLNAGVQGAQNGQTETKTTEAAPVSENRSSNQTQEERPKEDVQSFNSNDNEEESGTTRRGSVVDLAV